MERRVLIFSPYERDRQELVNFLKTYLIEKFDLDSLPIISAYHALFAPDEDKRLGHYDEVLVIFDQRLVPEKGGGKINRKSRDDLHSDYITYELHDKFLEAGLDASKKLCDSKQISYIFYKGDFEKGDQELLEERLNSVNISIRKKLMS